MSEREIIALRSRLEKAERERDTARAWCDLAERALVNTAAFAEWEAAIRFEYEQEQSNPHTKAPQTATASDEARKEGKAEPYQEDRAHGLYLVEASEKLTTPQEDK